jgi:hypothetical protein
MRNSKTQILILMGFLFFILLIASLFHQIGFFQVLKYANKDLILTTESLSPYISSISAHPQNQIYYKTKLTYPDGSPAKFRRIENKTSGSGNVIPQKAFTNIKGELIFSFQPSRENHRNTEPRQKINITSAIKNGDVFTMNELTLVPIPIVLVHGYRDTKASFYNLEIFLSEQGFSVYSLDYDSTEGILASSLSLEKFLHEKKEEWYRSGSLTNKFTLISHSYGGLVSRFYTASERSLYDRNDVDKIIFLAVPHKGTPFANLGKSFYNDEAIEELSPTSNLFLTLFPSMRNKGLSPDIQIGNVTVQYDEVISYESSLLDEWGIPSTMFNIGEDKRTFDNILKGELFENSNHHAILNNLKIFEKIHEMLLSPLPFPQKLN